MEFVPSTVREVLTGNVLLGGIFDSDGVVMVNVLATERNDIQMTISRSIYCHLHQDLVTTPEQQEIAWGMFKNYQERIRATLNDFIGREHQRELIAEMTLKAEEFRLLTESMKKTNKPHELGTVAEIAAKLNISKSEVRRLKAEGKLEELVNGTPDSAPKEYKVWRKRA